MNPQDQGARREFDRLKRGKKRVIPLELFTEDWKEEDLRVGIYGRTRNTDFYWRIIMTASSGYQLEFLDGSLLTVAHKAWFSLGGVKVLPPLLQEIYESE